MIDLQLIDNDINGIFDGIENEYVYYHHPLLSHASQYNYTSENNNKSDNLLNQIEPIGY